MVTVNVSDSDFVRNHHYGPASDSDSSTDNDIDIEFHIDSADKEKCKEQNDIFFF